MAIQEVIRKDGKRYRANVYTNKRRLLGKWHKIKKLAQIDETDIKHQLHTGTYINETGKTFDECAKIYFEVTVTKNMNDASISLEMGHYKNHIKPIFGHRKIISIKPYEIQKLWTDKSKTHSSSTVNRLHVIMNKIYKQFIKWEEVKHNPLVNVDKPRLKYGKTEVWNKFEVNKFLLEAKTYQSYIAFYIAIQTGMRMGEILALHWSDIDFENNLMSVTESLSQKTKKRGPLKTKSSKRLVSLDKPQMKVLFNHKKSQNPETEIVCSSSIGTYLNSSNIRRAMKSICKKSGVKRIRFHDLRHTHATLLVEAGVPAKAVSERLGHADVRITLERYTHLSNKTQIETAKRFTTLLNEES